MGEGDERAIEQYAGVQARFETVGGYTWREGVTNVVHGLGFVDDDLDRPLSTFSGGELTRGSLARVLASQAGPAAARRADEPPRHRVARVARGDARRPRRRDRSSSPTTAGSSRPSAPACSRSRPGRSRFFKGPWHAWRKEQAARELALGKAIARQEAEIARMERFVERFAAKASKARQAQDRVKKLSKLEAGRITRDPKDTRELGFQFKKPERSGRVIFELEHGAPGGRRPGGAAHAAARGRAVARARRARLARRARTAPGKTTLIKAIAGQAPFAEGRLKTGHNVTVGYLSQHGEELEFGGARTVLEAARQAHRADAERGARAARALPLLRRGGREAARRAQRRRAQAPGPRDPRQRRRQRARARRADQPPRPREPRGARGRAAGVPRLAAARDPRPRAARRRRHADDRGRGLHAALVRRRLGRVRPRARGAQGARASSPARRPPPRTGAATDRRARGGPTAWPPTARDARRAQPGRRAGAAPAKPKGPSKNRQKEQARLEAAIERGRDRVRRRSRTSSPIPPRGRRRTRARSRTARHTAARRAVEDAYAALEAFEARSAESAQA